MFEQLSTVVYSRQRVILDVITFLYTFAKMGMVPLTQEFLYSMVRHRYNITEGSSGEGGVCDVTVYQWPNGTVKETRELPDAAYDDGDLLVLYLNLADLLPTAACAVFLGWFSDLLGKRRFLMWLPCVGNIIMALGFLIPISINGVEYNRGTIAVLLIATAVQGFMGGFPGFLAGNACYISDTDLAERRTLRLAIVELFVGTSFAISTLIFGFWLRAQGFVWPFVVVLVISVAVTLIVLLMLPEPEGSPISDKPMLEELMWSAQSIFNLETGQKKKMWMVFVAFQVYVFIQQGQERTFVPFLEHHPLCWHAQTIGLFFFVMMMLSGLGSWPAIPLLQRKIDDTSIFLLAIVSKAAGSLLLSFAHTSLVVYLAGIVHVFHLAPFAVARSVVSQLVGSDEQGIVFGLLSSGQALLSLIGPLMMNGIFYASHAVMPGAVFLMSTAILVIPFIILVGLKFVEHQNAGYLDIDTGGPLTAADSESEAHTPMSEASSLVQPTT